ncbi:MAG TPA: DinB family protein [Flavitalea sp.]|nr:DinB family protein [Flavitalea sp.]
MPLSNSISSRLQFQHETIDELIRGYGEEQLKIRSVPDKWSPFENIAHLVLYQLLFQQRIVRILIESSPSFRRYVADNDPAFDEYLQRPLDQLMEILYSGRKQIYQQLHSISGHQLLLTGQHPVYGSLSLVQWTEFFLLHEAHHLFTLFKLLNGGRLRDTEIEEKTL